MSKRKINNNIAAFKPSVTLKVFYLRPLSRSYMKAKNDEMRKITIFLLVFFILCFLGLPCFSAEDISSQVDNQSKQVLRSDAASIKIKQSQQLLKEHPLEDIEITKETIDFGKIDGSYSNGYQKKVAAQKMPQNISHSGVSLRGNTSNISRPSKEKPTARWIKGKVSKKTSTLSVVTNSQSKELQKLQKQYEDRKASFEKSLEKKSVVRDSLLVKQLGSDTHASEKDNE